MNITSAYDHAPIEVLIGTYIFFASCAFCFVFVGYVHPEHPSVPCKQPSYAEKYYEAFVAFPMDELEKDQMKSLNKKYVKEHTDKGTVIMCYDYDNEAFHFWCDNSIPFQSLDAVAQLYTMVYICKAICVDYKAEYEKESMKQQKPQVTLPPPKVMDGPFATFKSYKCIQSNRKKKVVIPEKCNHFRKCGTIREWEIQEHHTYNWCPSEISDTGTVWCETPVEPPSNPGTLTYSEWIHKKDKTV